MENLTTIPGNSLSGAAARSTTVAAPILSGGEFTDSPQSDIGFETVLESKQFRPEDDRPHLANPKSDLWARRETLRFWISVLAPLVGSLAIVAALIFQIRRLNEIGHPSRPGSVSASYSWVDTVSDGGSRGNPGQAFSQTYVVPAGSLVANKVLRVTAYFDFSTSSAPPKLTLVLQLGKTNIASMTASPPAAAPPASASIETTAVAQGSAIWTIQGIEPAGPSVSVYAGSLLNLPGVSAANAMNDVPQPAMGIDTSSAATLDIAAVWAPGDTGKSTVTLQQFLVEALN